MEIIKNIAAVMGLIVTAATVTTIFSKTARNIAAKFFGYIFKKYGDTEPLNSEVADIKDLLERHIEDEKSFRKEIIHMNDINMEFTKTQCRNIIKNIFYKYNDTKVLPLYEKKTLMSVEDLYIKKLVGNSFAALLLDEMSHWVINYENSHPQDENSEL